MRPLATRLRYADAMFRGVPGVIATAVLEGPAGIALIDPGPSACLPALEADLASGGVSLHDVEAVVLTHIHLDHAGATGTIVSRRPGSRVYVHERGARHLIDPTRLMASATRLYGEEMDALWGEMTPVPAEAIQVLHGGERLTIAGHDLSVAYTPGHAQHHVAYLAHDARIAFVGDVGGCRTPAMQSVMPPTPPPDIDIDAWHDSVARVLDWQPAELFLTHFGPITAVAAHMAALLDRLGAMQELARRLIADEGTTEESRQQQFVEHARRAFRRDLSEEDLHRLELAVPLDLCWLGLARALRR